MKTKDEILDWALMQEGGVGHVSKAMDKFAKQQAVEFFKWNARSISEYMDYLKRVHNSEGMEEMELELNHFENNSIEGRYNLFIESQNKQHGTEG